MPSYTAGTWRSLFLLALLRRLRSSCGWWPVDRRRTLEVSCMRPLLNVTEQSVVASSLPQMQTKGPQGFDLRGASWAFVGSDSGFRGKEFGLSWRTIRAFVGAIWRWGGKGIRASAGGGFTSLIEHHFGSKASLKSLGQQKPRFIARRSIDSLCYFSVQAKVSDLRLGRPCAWRRLVSLV